ncbi:MAG: hypothetical protein WCI22_04620 [Actinomycetota bacterium]
MRQPGRPRRPARIALAAGLLVSALLWLVIEPISGAHLLHLFGTHGVDVGDLVAVAMVLAAAMVLRR